MLAWPPRTPAQNPPDPIPPRVGPVEAPATLRPPFATEVGRSADRGIRAPLLPGFSYDTNFACLKWFPQGPGLTTNGDLNISPDHPTSGGVSALAPHPTNPDILYIGTVNGGVWRSDNATSTNISWIPLTDDELSLSIGGLALDPTDVSGQTLVAGIGRRSSFGGTGGAQIGLLRTTTGGASWTRLGATALAGRSIYNLAVRGNVILLAVVSTDNAAAPGLYRTTDGGANFTNMSGFAGSGLPAGAVTHLATDPGNNARFYVHVGGNGVYRSDNSGATWVNVSAGMAAANVGQLALAVFNGGGTNVVWAAELTGTSRVYRSTNNGAAWLQMDSVQANTSGTFNGFTADPANPNLVYLSGLYVRANFPFSGRVVRGDASLSAGNQWIPIASTNGTGNGTAPHTDSRALTFNSAGRLIEGDDGGIYELPVANTGNNGTTSLWRSLNGNLQNSEMHSMAYDRLSKVLIGGAQDTGFQEQVRSGDDYWNKTSNGDGGDAAVEVMSLPGRSIRYGSSQNLGGFFRATFTNNVQLSRVFPVLTPLSGAPAISGQFVTPIAVNAVDPLRLVIGGANGVYESLNQGNSVSRLTMSVANSLAKIAYGGRVGTPTNADVLYVGSGSSVLQRTNTGGALTATTTAFPGGNVQSIVLNPTNWQIAYVVGTTNVYSTANAGASWVNLTGNLVGAGTFHSVEFLPLPGGNAVVVGTDLGAYIMRTASPGVWKTLGNNLPNAPVFDTHYDPVGNVLAASTFGRGAWLYDFNPVITNVVTTLAESGPGSLRDTIILANFSACPNVITFAVTGTIHLATTDIRFPTFTTSISLLGPGTNLLTISADNVGGILRTAAGTTNFIRGLRLANAALGGSGSALANDGNTTLENCVVENCIASFGFGGAVQNTSSARLSAANCVFVNNRTFGGQGENRGPGSNGGPGGGGAGLGGAINSEGTLTLSGCAFIGNIAGGGNGGNGDGNSFNSDAGGNGGGPNPGTGGSPGQPGGAGGFGGGGGGGAGSFGGGGFAGGAGGFGGGGGSGGANGSGGNGGAAGGSFSSHSGGGGGGAGLGGAIFVRTGAVTMVNCTFTGNLATNGGGGFGSFGGGNGTNGQGVGGALFNLNGSVTPINTTFSGNVASTALPDMDVSTLVSNLNDSGPGSLRQAIGNASGHAGDDTITFDVGLSGGVIRLTSAQLDINDAGGALTITATNLPRGITLSGEGARRVFNITAGSTVTLDSLTVSNGVSALEFGGGVSSLGQLTARRCTFIANQGYQGGAISVVGGTTTLEQSTLSGNYSPGSGGAIYCESILRMMQCTVVSNTSYAFGGGIMLNGSSAGFFTNCILAANTNLIVQGPDLFWLAGVGSVASAYNLVGDNTDTPFVDGVAGNRVGTAGSPLNPFLGPLRDNGGPTPTHAPLGGSPAIDAGDPLFNGYGRMDQRGLARVVNSRIDIGAVESGLRTFYSFDNESRLDLGGASSLTYLGDGSQWNNTDHRGQGNSAIALNDFVGGTPYGTNNYYRLTTPGDPTNSNRGLGLKGDFSVSAWVWPRVIGGWKIVLGTTITPGVPGTPVFGLLDNHAYAGFWGNDLPGAIAIPASQWTHLAWTYSSYGGQMALYVNGQLDNSAVGRTNTTLGGELLLGFSAALANSYFQGFIDEFAIFGEALSPSQITALAAPNGILPNAILPAPVLSPGLVTAACGWNVREIYAHTGDPALMPYDLPSAEHIANTPQSGTAINYSSSVINRLDPDVGLGLTPPFAAAFVPFAGNNLTPQGLINGDDNYFALAAATTIHIAAEDDYTFGFLSDDGAPLRVKGAVFASSTAIGAGNPATPAHRYDTLAYPASTGNSLTLGVTHLMPGDYDVEFLYWEYGGAAFSEVFAARGAKTALDGSFRLLSPTLFATHPTLSLVPVAPTQVRVTWTPTNSCDHLQSAPSVTGPWTDVPGAVSGQLLPATSARQFFRVAQ